MQLPCLAYGLSDAVTAYQYGGAKGAVLAASNNLPQVGEAIGKVGDKFANATTKVGRFARAVGRFAGPAGLVASIAAPFATMFMGFKASAEEASRAVDHYRERLERLKAVTSAQIAASHRTRALRSAGRPAIESGLGQANDRLAILRSELGAAYTIQQNDLSNLGSAQKAYGGRGLAGVGQDIWDASKFWGDPAEAEIMKERMRNGIEQVKISTEGLARATEAYNAQLKVQKQLETALRLEKEKIASRRESLASVPIAERREYETRQSDRKERLRIRGIADDAMGRSIIAGMLGGRADLVRSMEMRRRSARSFERPEAVSRGNAFDKILEMAANREASKQEKLLQDVLKKDEEKLKKLDQLIDAVRIQQQPQGRQTRF